jgi:quinol-cytochrome oxidoreductase complex cytochrome b subunit
VTFHDQLRSTFRLGTIILSASALLFIAMYGANSTGYVAVADVLFVVALIVLGLAVLALIPGLIGRAAHRWMWFNVITRSDQTVFGRTVAQRLLESPASPILRLWLHIDPEGNDRD